MTNDEWDIIAGILEEWWPGEFTDITSNAWRIGLDEFEFEQVGTALKVVARRQARAREKFRPSMPEVLAVLEADGDSLSSAEVVGLLWEKGGAMHARSRARSFDSSEARALADETAICDAAYELNRDLGGFLATHGVRHLRLLDPRDPQWGEANRKKLVAEWEEFCEVRERRQVRELVSGRRGELGRVDPLRSLGTGA